MVWETLLNGMGTGKLTEASWQHQYYLWILGFKGLLRQPGKKKKLTPVQINLTLMHVSNTSIGGL